jgi:hypothetical protein
MKASRRDKDMKRLGIILLSASMLLAQPVVGQVSPRPLNDTETVKFVGTPNTFWGLGTKFGPYTGALNMGADPTWASISIVCVDYGNHVYSGSIWDVNVTNVGQAGSDADMANTRVGAVDGSLLRYQKAAYLASMFTSGAAHTWTEWADLHWAIWSIMSPAAFTNFVSGPFAYAPSNNWVQALSGYAVNDSRFGGFDFTQWSVLSDQNMSRSRPGAGIGGIQEQLVRNPSVAPEPETYILLVSGLFFLAIVSRRRLKEMGYF